jgi:hypothetical protein
MSALEFKPDSVFKGQKKLYDILIDLNNGVERPLRNASMPEMPANVRGAVQSNIQAAINAMATARVDVAKVAGELKRRSYDLVEHDDPTKMPWWVKPGDFMVAAAEFTGTDIIYKTSRAVSGEGSWGDVGWSAFSFATNFVPIGKVGNAARVGKTSIAEGGAHLLPHAGQAAEGARLLPHAGDAAKTARHIGSFETTLSAGAKVKKWRWGGGHLDSALNSNHIKVAEGAADASGVRWVNVASRDVLNSKTVTQQWKTFFPKNWTEGTIQQAAATIKGATPPNGTTGVFRGVKFVVHRDADGALKTIYPVSSVPEPTWIPSFG